MARPFALDPLFRPLTALAGVGPRNAKLLEKLAGGPKLLDLLWHRPIDRVDRRHCPPIQDLRDGMVATLTLRVGKHFPAERKGRPYRVWCSDETGTINLVFFHANDTWLKKQLPEDSLRIVSGRVEFFNGAPQIVHPDAIGTPEDKDKIAVVEPVYPLTAGVTNKLVRKAIAGALENLPILPEWLDPAHKKKNNWPEWPDAVRALHAAPLDTTHPARQRLAYDELLANQLTIALMREKQKKSKGRGFAPAKALREKLAAALPYTLTGAQARAIAEIDSDMGENLRMTRLLQGDVGSGKTIVAAMAMLNAVAGGAQTAFLAPTEILARQHAATLTPLLEKIGITCAIFTGRDKGKTREDILERVRNGTTQIIIGTHAIFQDGVEFHDLGLAVIDEQHRFGVHQRLQLSSKGRASDILVMTATPIPRTLALTAYGDMDVSRLDEKPPGRRPIDTRLIPAEKTDEMVAGIARQVAAGAQAYWVCPLVEESETLDLAAADARHADLQNVFGDKVGLLHGRMKPTEKDAVMEAFARGTIRVLVATTVIEVGVDVPDATIMVIEHAERFGLAQLHQLRGRVGRGRKDSYCFLLYHGPLGEAARERLGMLRQTEDGFLIAEKDLELRGAGDALGSRQSGLPLQRLAELPAHTDLLQTASDDARLIVSRDPALKTPRGEALRALLYLFERDQALQLLRAG